MKKILILLFSIAFLSGCGSMQINSSPDSVALEMAKRMSTGDYAKITELLSGSKDAFVDEKSFEKYLTNNGLNIEGNELYELKEETEVEENDTTATVQIKIDDNKILRVNTVKEDGKWYVDLGSYSYDEDLIIHVPTGSTIKLNDTALSYEKYAKTEQSERYWQFSSKYIFTENYDIYTIPKLLRGNYDLTITNKNAETIKTTINSKRSYYSNSEDYFLSTTSAYITNLRPNAEMLNKTKAFVKDYLEALMEAYNKKSEFKTLDSYFASTDTTTYSTMKQSYDKQIENNEESNSYSKRTNTNFKYGLFSYNDRDLIYYYSEDTIIVIGTFEMTYHYTKDYFGILNGFTGDDEDRSKKTNMILHLKLDKGNMKIVDGTNLIPTT